MFGPEKELDAIAAACVCLSLPTGVFQLEEGVGLALADPVLPEGVAEGVSDGVADADAVPALPPGSAEFDAGSATWGATVTTWGTAGCCGT